MNEQLASLDRLHDIVLPGPVPWWPPAPGWYVVAAVLLFVFARITFLLWRRWQAGAYRRAALRELAGAHDAAAIAEVLRRTALAVAPRHTVAVQSGPQWLDWLARHFPDPVPARVLQQLTAGVYAVPNEDVDTSELREFAARWIAEHHVDGGSDR